MESFCWENRKTKQEIFTILPKRNINWEKYINFWKLFYTKVCRKRRLTNSPKFTVLLVLKQRKNNSLVLKWQTHSGYSQDIYSKEFNHMTWMAYNVSINSFSQDMQLFKEMNMIIKHHNWNKLARMIGIKEGSSTKASRSLFHSSTSV